MSTAVSADWVVEEVVGATLFDQLAAARAEAAAARAEAEAWKQRAFTAEAQLETNNSEVRRHQECIATLRAARWSSLPIAAAAATEATATHLSEHARQLCELSILSGELLHTEQSLQDASLAAMQLGVKAEEYLQMLAAVATTSAFVAPASRRSQRGGPEQSLQDASPSLAAMQFCGKADECLAALTNSASVAPAPRRSQRGSAVLRETNSAKLQSYMADALAQRPTPTMAYAPTNQQQQQQQRVRLSMK
jgi:hypothetical protein